MPSGFGSPSPTTTPVEERILLLASTPEEASVLASALERTNVATASFTTLDALVSTLQEGAGGLLVEEDAITKRGARLLSSAMVQREPWSNLPIIILTSGDPAAIERLDTLDLFGPATAGNITILERPVHEVTLTTVVHTALRARRRQYEVRDLMADLRATNEQLRESQAALQATNETLEERVAARTEKIRQLALALTTAEQRERARISELLHDHVQQLIHGARIWADTLADGLDRAPPEALERLSTLLDEAIEATRSLSVELSPPVLQKQGLLAALDWLATHVADTHNLTLTLDLPDALKVPEEDLRTLLFRSLRELVFNVAKHAEVDTAHLRVRRKNGTCVAEVWDEGAGFTPDTLDDAAPNDHFGLFSIRERIDLVGGSFSIESTPGEGTHATITVPLSE
jgi:signal transduction histidine kinase